MTRLLPSRSILHRGVLIALGLLIVLLAVGSPDRASAQSAALVSNVGKGNTWTATPRSDYAQEFTTGSATGGYTLTSVDIQLAFPSPPGTKSAFTVTINASNSGEPGNVLATLTAPQTLATGNNTFSHTGLDLSASTKYVVVVDGGTTGTGSIRGTDSNDEDSTAGWAITNGHKKKLSTSTSWTDDTGALQIRVNGTTAVDYVPAFTVALDHNAAEGTTMRFRLQLYDRNAGNLPVVAPAGGLTVNLTVSDTTTVGADFLAPASEGAKTVTFAEGESTATYSVPTVDDDQDEPNGEIKLTLVAGTGYTLGINDNQTSRVTDNDEPDPVLVSNIGETTTATPSFLVNEHAQEFTTGSHSLGYTLTSVDLGMAILQSNRATFTVAVHASSGGQPGDRLASLTAPQSLATGTNTFTHAGLDLDPSTSYFVVIDVTSNGVGTGIDTTSSDAESGESGWSISNVGHSRAWNSTGTWTTGTSSRKIGINGTVKGLESLVSNITETSGLSEGFTKDFAQEFTTGVNWTGYTLTSVDIGMVVRAGTSPTFTVSVHASSNGRPGTKLATLTAPGTIADGNNTFTHTGLALAPATSYFVVVDVTSSSTTTAIRTTTSDRETGAKGASINNVGFDRNWNSTGAWIAFPISAIKMQVNGIVKPKPPVGGRDIFIANMSATNASTVALGTYDIAQEFRTGGHQDGYTLTSIYLDLEFTDRPRAPFTVSVHEYAAGRPGKKLATLDNPHWGNYWNGIYEWTHPGLKLGRHSHYYVVIDSSGSGNGVIRTTTDNRPGVGSNVDGAAGQTLYSYHYRRGRDSTSATDYSNQSNHAIKLFIKGVIDEGPEDMILTVSPDRVDEDAGPTTLTFTANIGTPHPNNFYFNVDHSASLGEAYACSGRPSYDCLPVALSPRDYRGDNNWRGPTDYAVLGHYIGNMIPAGQTSVTWTETFIPYDDKVEEGEEYIYFIPEHGKFPPVRFTLANSEAAFSPDEPDSTGPAELTGLTLAPVAGEPTKLAVSWDPVEGAARYDVRWKDGSRDSVEATTNSYTITGLTPDTNYTVTVAAVGADNVVLAEGTATGPYWPVSVAPVAGRTDALYVSWEAVEGAFHYFIRVNGGPAIEARAPRTSLQLTGLDPDTEYAIALEAMSTMRDGFETLAERDVTGSTGVPQSPEPGALLGLTVHPVGGETTQLAVSWQAVPDADKYTVKWKSGSDSYNSGTETTSASHTITGLAAGASYTVQVTAVDTDADPDAELAGGEASGATLAAMGAVSVAAVEGSSDILEVSWPAVPGATGYVVEWKQAGGAYGTFARSETAATSGRLTSLEPETAYTVRVTARHTIGGVEADGDSAEGSATTNAAAIQPDEPDDSDQQGSESMPDVVFVIYHDPDAGEAVVDRYNQAVKLLKDAGIKYSEVIGGVQDDVDRLAGVTGSVLPRFFLSDPTASDWVSQPGENNGGLRWLRDKTSEIGDDKAGAPEDPAVLGGLTVNPVSGETTSLAVSWNAVTGADKYLVQWKTGADDYNSGDTVTTNSHTITGLAGSTVYTVQVTAIDTDADPEAELAAGEASGATLATVGTVTVAAVADSSDSLDVSWLAVSGAVGYVVEWKTGSSNYTAVNRSDATATSERITGLEAETAYTVKVTARHTIAGLEANGDSAEGSGTTNAAPAQAPPANIPASGAPSISGTAQVGETLTANTSGISDADGLSNATYSYQWLADGSDISGATSSAYTLVAGDAGKVIKVTVSFTDDAGNAESLTSAATDAVVATNTPASGAPTISGTAQVGETLTANTSGISDADGLANATYSYQWLADGSDISGATSSTYTPVSADVGKAIKVTVSFTDDAGNAESLTSAATAAVAAEDPPEEEAAAVSFVIYHDPDAGDEAVDRYNQGVKLLKDANISYSEVKGDVQDDVDSLAGVTDSVIPRFFLGDPTEEGWTSEPGENNGGLRWLKEKVAELGES